MNEMGPGGHYLFSQNDLGQLHQFIEERFSEILGQTVQFEPEAADRAELEKSCVSLQHDSDPKKAFFFNLRNHPSNKSFAIAKARESDGPDSDQIVFQVAKPDKNGDAPWVGWSDAWVKLYPGKKVLLKSAGFTFYWGRGGPEEARTRVVRAEWDQVPLMGGRAGQPHWHIDKPFVVGRGRFAVLGAEDVELIDLDQPGAGEEALGMREVQPKGIHLSMAGWNFRHDHPELTCWQSRAGDWRSVADWAEKTLIYMKEQFERIRPARVLGVNEDVELLD